MSINPSKYDTSLDAVFNDDYVAFLDVKYSELPDGEYRVQLARVYKWKPITKDTFVTVLNADGSFAKDGDTVLKEELKDFTWNMCDVVLRVSDNAAYKDVAVKCNLSTHPDMKRALSNFMTSFGLAGIPISDVVKHIGAYAIVAVKNKTRVYTDKDTGMEKTITEPKASFFKRDKAVEGDFGV